VIALFGDVHCLPLLYAVARPALSSAVIRK
jgi:hypothetical protein